MKPPRESRAPRVRGPVAALRLPPARLFRRCLSRPRPRTRTLLLAVGLPLLLLTGCGTDTGGLAGAGATATASGPVHLWPHRQGATVLPPAPGGEPPQYVRGLPPVVDQNVHGVDPVALVQAELKAHGDQVVGPDGMPAGTADAIRSCEPGQAGDGRDAGRDSPRCPVLKPYYRDLTGNGKDELIMGIEFPGPEHELAVRVYTADPDGRLNRIMATTQPAVSVELAGPAVIVRAPSGNPGYELATAWSYDVNQRAMLPTREQITRVTPAPTPTPTPPAPTPTPASAPRTTPAARAS
ncbi:hypothetical protein [Streptomyces sp. NPDC048603]|uniref:hypothetical protein n=1 Tax=Streptomyces sp. NPDC048603 TaxID=3365577 RepID=UPI003710278C